MPVAAPSSTLVSTSAQLPARDLERLRAIAGEKHVSVGAVIRWAVEAYLAAMPPERSTP